jgi:hypothetical protein
MRRAILAAAAVAAVVAGGAAAAAVSSNAAAANGCTPWSTLETTYPLRNNGVGAQDRSISLGLQYQRCTVGTDSVHYYRVAVHNILANGKVDVAVGLKDGYRSDVGIGVPACGRTVDNRVYGTWHPRVVAGTTWLSSRYHVVRGPYDHRIWAEIHVQYPADSARGWTDLCREIPSAS